MAPPVKNDKISSWHTIEYPLEDLLETDKIGLKNRSFEDEKVGFIISFVSPKIITVVYFVILQ